VAIQYLINIHQYDLVWSAEVHPVDGIDGIGDAFDHIVPLQSVVTAYRRANSILYGQPVISEDPSLG
jgi:hypothetical protein